MTTDSASEALEQLRTRLNQLHREGGEPSSREVSQRTRRAISHTTVNQVLRCARAPRWNNLEVVVEALGGSIAEFRALWVAVRNGESPGPASAGRQQEIFASMARRSQTLIDQFAEQLSYMRRGELAPRLHADALALERIVKRMQRHNENLLLLANVDLGGPPKDPVPLIDVIRAAQAELGVNRRVEVNSPHREAGIMPSTARPVIRIVAELLDNAFAFSSPDGPPVMIKVTATDSGVVVRIEDHGLGIPAVTVADFEQWLRNADSVGTVPSRTIGLVIVARLAVRHAIGVELRRRTPLGSVAVVTVPVSSMTRMTQPLPTPHAPFPDRGYRAIFAGMPPGDRAKLVDLLPHEQVRLVLAGLAADRAQSTLDRTRPPDWPAAQEPPARRDRPGLPASRPAPH
ncbi:ATP-binding protein [Micromonospora sp. WMMC241]|uniref:sensor histidine kinase n=1 Tax=Micromonospora sp. WMMC241 TaxID=3015159 RepID=UPI0022B72ADE|nr:ATP-binding protein [Micromonospora sp. WMMC241]MCZ7436768.1 ATP-binding protein [Micromonospora sp. WMMC241]